VRPSPPARSGTGAWPIFALVALLLTSLTLMSDATQGSARFGQLYSLLLISNALGLVILSALIGWHLVRLLGQVRRGVAGARLTARMVAMFVVLAVTPVVVVYYFSLQFLHRGIDSWFDVRIEEALEDSLELSRTALGVRMRELLKQTELLATELSGVPDQNVAARLEDTRRLSGATELTLFSPKGRIIASINADPMAIVPHRPDDGILLQLRQSGNYIGLDPIGDVGLHVRVVVRVPDPVASADSRVLQALYPVTERMNALADSVQGAFAKYRELAYLRKPLKISFTLTLSLVLLLSLLTAVWSAFFSARRMVAPLRDVVQGTQAVAAGDYGTQLPEAGKDELGFLVASFNEMSRELARARDETRQSQRQIEEQRTYLEAVLARLSSGVLTLDQHERLFTFNLAAEEILGVELEAEVGRTLDRIAAGHEHLGGLAEAVRTHLAEPHADWREEVILLGASGRQVLMCRGTPLPVSDNPVPGHVVVFDDVTALIQAQRDAAWSEVARRLAHEIKNPLTPIRLSAERLRQKYLGKLDGADAEGLDRLTRTIVQQVEGMKGMVNAFSAYARPPRMQPERLDLNQLVEDVLALYSPDEGTAPVQTALGDDVPEVDADPDRIRQVVHNLVKNAIEASGGARETGDGAGVHVRTRGLHERGTSLVELRVSDSGSGFREDIMERAFEPYATTKGKGSGLGLAIVKKIVEEHGGVVWAENNAGAGASVVVRLPTAVEEGTGGAADGAGDGGARGEPGAQSGRGQGHRRAGHRGARREAV